jgi:hypothetical protein
VSTQKFTPQEIVALNREYTFFSWSVQKTTNPIPMVKAEGIYFGTPRENVTSIFIAADEYEYGHPAPKGD